MEKLTTDVLIGAIDHTNDFYENILRTGASIIDRDSQLKLEGILIGIGCVKELIIELEG